MRWDEIPPKHLIHRLRDVARVLRGRHMTGAGGGGLVRQRARDLVHQPIHLHLGDAHHPGVALLLKSSRQRRGLSIRGAKDGLPFVGLAVACRQTGAQPSRAPPHPFHEHRHRCPLSHWIAFRRGPERRFRGVLVQRLHGRTPLRAADSRLRRHRLRQPRARLPRQRRQRMDEELQQPMRIQRFPHQRQGQLHHLAGGAKRRIVLKAGARQADALQGVVEHDAVAAGDDHRTLRIVQAAQRLRDRMRRDVAAGAAHHKQRTVAAQRRRRLPREQRLQLA